MTVEEYAAAVEALHPRGFADGRVAYIYPLLFTAAICVSTLDNVYGYDDRWCYHSVAAAKAALDRWDGEGEPTGWHRHPASGRRRPDGDAAREYVQP